MRIRTHKTARRVIALAAVATIVATIVAVIAIVAAVTVQDRAAATDAAVFLCRQTLVYAIPLLAVALAGVFAERSGIVNIALDGMMIFGAFIGAVTAYLIVRGGWLLACPQGLYLLAMLAAAAAGALFSLLLSVAAVCFRADQTIVGTALNLLAAAIVLFALQQFFGQKTLIMPADMPAFVMQYDTDVPLLRVLLDKSYLSTPIVLVLFTVLSLWLYQTRTGLHLRACGENPAAAASVGIRVGRMRLLGTTVSGALAGLGGYVYIATVAGGSASGSVSGLGFLAIAIMIFGNWKPLPIALGAGLFGFLKCLGAVYTQLDLNGDGICTLGTWGLPAYFYYMLPYLAVLVVLAFTSGHSRAPQAAGVPYET